MLKKLFLIFTVIWGLYSCSIFDLDIPEVVSIQPGYGAMRISPNDVITIYFSIPMNKQSVESSLKIWDIKNQSVSGEFKWIDDKSVVFDPLNNFLIGKKYYLSLDTTVEANNGRNLFQNLNHYFIVGDQELEIFKFIEISPSNRSTITDQLTDIEISFNHPVSFEEIRKHLSLNPVVAYEINYGLNSNRLILRTIENYSFRTVYEIQIANNLKNIWGHTLDEDITSRFTVGDDFISPVLTQLGTRSVSNVDQNQSLTHGVEKTDFFYFHFSEPIPYATFKSGVDFSDQVAFDIIPLSTSSNFIIHLAQPLQSEKIYSIELNENIKDEQENPLDRAPFVFRFKVDGPQSLRPQVLSYTPAGESSDTDFNQIISLPITFFNRVGYYSNFQISFNRPLQEFSLFQNILLTKVSGSGSTTTLSFDSYLIQSTNIQLDLKQVDIGNIYKITLKGGDESGIYDSYTNYLNQNFELLITF